VHAAQVTPPVPHARGSVPAWHDPSPAQQPLQESLSHVHAPPLQRCPAAQVPCVQTPPQPSPAPHALPVHCGTHAAHPFAPHVSPGAHAAHATPPAPHAVTWVPGSHAAPRQQPAHDVESHTHAPFTQWSPCAHVPAGHAPPHPSGAPHAFPVHVGTHGPVPQTFGPPAPHWLPAAHCPQLTTVPQ
jgi:hypothetical protein